MMRQRTGNLAKGFAWLLLAVSTLPALAINDAPSGAATRLTVGLPWSPWLVYREWWVKSEAATATTPTLRYETTIEPRSDSTVVMFCGAALLLASWLLRSQGSGSGLQGSGVRRQKSEAGRQKSAAGSG